MPPMPLYFTSHHKSTSSVVAAGLALWLSGVGCLLCLMCCWNQGCAGLSDQSCQAETDIVASDATKSESCHSQAESSASHCSASGGGCCASSEESVDDDQGDSLTVESLVAFNTSQSGCEWCACEGKIELLPASRPSDTPVDQLPAKKAPSVFTLSLKAFSPAPQVYLPNRGHTYLKCCVFLI